MIGIIGAMDKEVNDIIALMSEVKKQEVAGMIFHAGILNGCKVVVVRSGIGKVNSAACTQILIDKFDVEKIIDTGIAGGLAEKVNIGDIVISKDAIQHDFDTTIFGDQPGEITNMHIREFPADDELIDIAKKSCDEAVPDVIYHVGRILTGDQFISNDDVKARLREVFDGTCAEMEGAAIAHVAYINRVPFVIIRAISDKAGSDAYIAYDEFQDEAINRFVKLLYTMVSKLA